MATSIWNASQKADLLSFVRDDGKGFIGISQRGHHLHGLARVWADARRVFRRPSMGQFNAPLVWKTRSFPTETFSGDVSRSSTRFIRIKIIPERTYGFS